MGCPDGHGHWTMGTGTDMGHDGHGTWDSHRSRTRQESGWSRTWERDGHGTGQDGHGTGQDGHGTGQDGHGAGRCDVTFSIPHYTGAQWVTNCSGFGHPKTRRRIVEQDQKIQFTPHSVYQSSFTTSTSVCQSSSSPQFVKDSSYIPANVRLCQCSTVSLTVSSSQCVC